MVLHVFALSQAFIDKISDFLSKFVGPPSSDVTDGMADMDIGDEDSDPETQRTRGLKYMSQLVRVYIFKSNLPCPKRTVATHCESRPTNACHRPRGYR